MQHIRNAVKMIIIFSLRLIRSKKFNGRTNIPPPWIRDVCHLNPAQHSLFIFALDCSLVISTILWFYHNIPIKNERLRFNFKQIVWIWNRIQTMKLTRKTNICLKFVLSQLKNLCEFKTKRLFAKKCSSSKGIKTGGDWIMCWNTHE